VALTGIVANKRLDGDERLWAVALGALGAGAAAVVLVALPYKAFDLDRYFVPKELFLHLTAVVAAGAAVLAAAGRGGKSDSAPVVPLARVDILLAAFLVLSAVSALFAVNRWQASRELAISVSGIVMFWVAQSLSRAGRPRTVLAFLAMAVTLGAVTLLLQAYGVETEFFSLNRSPGGTLGNRNFVAHLLVIGIPALVASVLLARRSSAVMAGAVATVLVTAALVLSRSRAAWVAAALSLACTLPGAWRAWRAAGHNLSSFRMKGGHERPRSSVVPRARGSPEGVGLRSAVVGVAALVGICGAILLPNTLNWRSPSPYLDSVIGVTNYRGGSGRGRLVQYANTARLTIMHPLLGVGPGNWAVAYPRIASANDPSIDADDGMTANPWPSSDWAAFASERGLPATICIALAMVGLLVAAGRTSDAASEDGRVDRLVLALALVATVVALVTVGVFDAVLLLPTPSLIAWCILGAVAGTLVPAPVPRMSIALGRQAKVLALVAIVGLGAFAVLRSTLQVAAMALYVSAPATAAGDRRLELAAQADPGSYRIQMRLAELYLEGRSCNRARTHARAAEALFPTAPAPHHVLAECGGATR
jgi:hypothetical protein